MKRSITIVVIYLLTFPAWLHAQVSPFEKSQGKQTATYEEIIRWYRQLDQQSDKLLMKEMGTTDAGYPLHLVILNHEPDFDPVSWRRKHQSVILVNNGIHPGEPDGIDASMMLARDLLTGKNKLPDNIVLAIIPVYNIGGCLNRNAYTRVNQNGPESYGFRGNSQNLDLNRDFTKCDSREAMIFSSIFHELDPDVFVDTHVSDGADYQHTMTLISTQYNKLGNEAGRWMKEVFEPALYKGMSGRKWDMVPYVDFDESDPKKGMYMFYDPPRYSSGYAALFGTLAYVPETHMLKPFEQRVRSTYDLLLTFIQTTSSLSDTLQTVRQRWKAGILNQSVFPLSWVRDSGQYRNIRFSGYNQDSTMSEATGLKRMYYNHQKPFDTLVRYYDEYKPARKVTRPLAYIIRHGWQDVIDRMKQNGVRMQVLEKDTVMSVEAYYIEDYATYPRPYEKHHKNHSVRVYTRKKDIRFLAGDYIIYTNQPANRYIVEMLEPTGDDSFFAWNFFDAILQQKEGFSDYRWEELAADVLKRNPALKDKLEKKKQSDPKFAQNSSQILDYIYDNSEYLEPDFRLYPVFRLP